MTHVATPSSAHRRRSLKGWIAAGLTALLAIGGIAAVVVPASATEGFTGEISGTVLLPNGDPAGSDAKVDAWRYDSANGWFEHQGFTTVVAGGAWSFPELPIGSYTFKYSDTDATLVSEYGSGDDSVGELLFNGSYTEIGQDETFDAGTFQFHVGGTVEVSVRRLTFHPIGDAQVVLYRWSIDPEGEPDLSVSGVEHTTDEGSATFTGLPDGVYTAQFSQETFATQLWDGVYDSDPSHGNTFTVTGGTTTPLLAKLPYVAKISGALKGANGVGLEGVPIFANRFDGTGWFDTVTTDVTGLGGVYDLEGLPPGDYRLRADPLLGPFDGVYLPGAYPAAVDIDHGSTIHVEPGADVQNRIITLLKTSAITGKITLGPTTSPATYPGADEVTIMACLIDQPCGLDFGGPTAVVDPANGNYRIGGLAPGTYTLFASYQGIGNYRDEYYNNVRDADLAAHIKVGSQATVSGKNMMLDLGSTISGKLTDRFDNPVPNYPVGAYSTYGGIVSQERPTRWATTDENGEYTIGGLPSGSYLVKTAPEQVGSLPTDIVGPWYADTYNVDKAKRIKLTVPASATGIDLKADNPATIYGTIVDANLGQPLPFVNIEVYRFDTAGGTYAQYIPNAYPSTDEDGHYEVKVPPGQYIITALGDQTHRGRAYDVATDSDSPSAGTRINVVAGEPFEASWALDLGGAYTGRIVDAGGDPIPNVMVDIDEPVSGDVTNANGRFDIQGLVSGSHTLRIQGDGVDYVATTRYDAPPTTYNALPVNLGDIMLEAASTIEGVVRSTSGTALPNVGVTAYTVARGGKLEYAADGISGSKGQFTLTGLPTGNVYLEFDAPGATYQDQFLGGSTIWSLSDAVTIPAPGSTEHVEARLVTGGSIGGVIKNKATGKVASGVPVTIVRPGIQGYPEYTDTTITNSTGAYIFPGLEAGGYQISFNTLDYGPTPKAYTVSTSTVTVADRTKTTVNRSLVPQSKISGVVKIGTALAENVVVTAVDANGIQTETTTSATGAYTLPLDIGVYRLFFTDPDGRAQAAYYKSATPAGSPGPVGATTIKVTGNGAGQPGKSITLAAGGGSVTATFIGDEEADPSGYFVLNRLDAGAPDCTAPSIESSVTYYPPSAYQPLNDLFPITNLRPGEYCLLVFGQSALSDGGGPYVPASLGPFSITEGGLYDMSTISLGAPTSLSHYDDADVLAGGEPEVFSDGSPQVGEMVFLTPGIWSRDTLFHPVQWTRNGKPIDGAQDLGYLLQPGDAGATIAAQIGATDFPDAGPEAYSFTATLALPIEKAAAAIAFEDPSITGKPNNGQTLTAVPGTWNLLNLSFGYEWTRDGTPITGATGKTYKLTAADIGKLVAVTVTASRPGFESTSRDATGVSILPAIALKATALPTAKQVGAYFVVTNKGTWTPTPATYQYDWLEYLPTGGANLFSTTYASDPDPRAEALERELTDTRISVRITVSKPGYASITVEVPVRTGPVPAFTTPPVLSTTTPQPGIPISVDLGAAEASPPLGELLPTVRDVVSTPSYQWYKGATAISGATKSTYIPKQTDAGSTLSVRVTLKAPGYATPTTAQWNSGPTTAVASATLTDTGGQQILGLPAVGRKLVADTGTWSAVPTSFAFQWFRGPNPISKATTAAYTPVAADLGSEIRVRITAKLGTLSSQMTTTEVLIEDIPIGVVNDPQLPATVRVGSKVTLTPGTWDVSGVTVGYQWTRNGEPIVGATAASYTPIPADLGEELGVLATAKRTGFTTGIPAESKWVTVELGAAQVATKAPVLTISGAAVTTVLDQRELTASGGTWPVAPESLTYRWQTASATSGPWTDLPGFTGSKLTPNTSTDPTNFVVGQYYRVVVTAIRTGYASGEKASAPVRLVGLT